MGVGYEWNSWLRFDVTGEYRTKAAFKATGTPLPNERARETRIEHLKRQGRHLRVLREPMADLRVQERLNDLPRLLLLPVFGINVLRFGTNHSGLDPRKAR